MNLSHFTFNTTGSMTGNSSNQLYLDSDGNIINRNKIEYGQYNKIIKINFNFNKFMMLKKKYIGIGDIIDFITKKTGIKKFMVWITKGNCGCEARRIKFNKYKLFYYVIKFREIYANDLIVIKKQKELFKNIKPLEQKVFKQQHNSVSNLKPVQHKEIKNSCGCAKKNLTNKKIST